MSDMTEIVPNDPPKRKTTKVGGIKMQVAEDGTMLLAYTKVPQLTEAWGRSEEPYKNGDWYPEWLKPGSRRGR